MRGYLTNLCAAIAVVVPLSVPSCDPVGPLPMTVEFYRASGYSFSWWERRTIRRVAEEAGADARRVLEQNDPQHPWLAGHWPKHPSVLKRLNPFTGESR